MAKNHLRSNDAHFQDAVGSISLCHLPIYAANTVIMSNNYQVTGLLPDLQDQKSLLTHIFWT